MTEPWLELTLHGFKAQDVKDRLGPARRLNKQGGWPSRPDIHLCLSPLTHMKGGETQMS